ncbi:ATP-binding cassette domain-containing protein [Geomonas nitrogeniifigens]|uniref:ATP-binding cassette domain-containing protein n=1 Tax=Geomonas diazotrophica TaxID=2843197 RepID=A0ABX8JQM0_9BACT|nr:ABC-F family ATP-binding cassette domain-containing protein [Geomonas nitrogeniifigens]QWV98922.1 ATP-binding cassette domain-containing protein [Geomonas nitrogeniifigens]QXE88070.1 ATP-binding cassette domain-containing protein [Geomonas nitrogeniifigens]
MIHLSNITKQHGSQVLFRDASFQILPGSRSGLVGPNGAGKTSLFRIITGEEEVDAGEITLAKKTTIGYFSQNIGEMAGRSALEEVMAVSAETVRLAAELKQMEEQMGLPMSDDDMASLLERYGSAMEEFEHRGGYDLDSRAKEVLTGLGIGPERFHNPVESFSGGWRMRVALAGILTLQPDVLLLDEPTNHLDVESIIWLEEWIASEYKGALLMTSHDRDFMNRVVNRIVEVANKTVTTYGGNYDFYEREREIRREQLLASYKRQQEMLAKEEEFIARFAARASHAAQVQSRVKKIEKIERIEIPPEERVVKFEFATPPRSGDDVVVMDNLGKSWANPDGSVHPIFSGVTGVIKRMSKIAVVGVNGAGKSTFLKTVAGQTEATEGSVNLGANVELGYFSQHAMEVLDPKKTIFETVQDVIPMATIGVIRNLLGAFLFQGDDVDKRIENLSGGEKSRVVLATLLARPVNFLVLDEPTNHLDIRSREILLDALESFQGTVILVSHDRHFLRKLVDRVIEVDHGEMRLYEGNYDYYLSKTAHA